MSAAIEREGGFAPRVIGSKARFLICIQVQYVITHEQGRLKGQIFKHLTVQLLPDLYTHSFYSWKHKFGDYALKWFLVTLNF